MPIVTEKIVMDIESRVDDVIKDSKQIVKSLDDIKKHTKDTAAESARQAKAMSDSNKKASMSITDFRNAYGIVMDVMRAGRQVWDATISKHLEYAKAVRELSNVNGQSAEDTSRLIQVLDDYGFTTEKLSASLRVLSKEGKTLTVDTLANMADEYAKLGTQQEKNKFLLENLGREGLKYAEIMEKGGDAIRKQSDEISENLILTDKQAKDARRLEIAWDGFTDSLAGMGNVLSAELTPAITTVVESWDWATQSAEKYFSAIANGEDANLFEILKTTANEIKNQNEAMAETPEAAEEAADSVESLAAAEDAAKQATQRLTSEFQGLISTMFSIQDGMDSYSEKTTDITKKEEELRAEKTRLGIEMGKVNNNQEKYLDLIQKSVEIDQKLAELDAEKTKATEDLAEAGKKRVYDLTQQRLAADGVVDSGEFEYLQNLAVQQGLVSRAAANLAIEESKKADAFVQSYQSTNPLMKEQLAIMQQMQAMSGTVVQFSVNYSSNLPSGGMNPYTSPKTNTQYKSQTADQYAAQIKSRLQGRDNGGPGVAGTPYAIGNIREIYKPKQSGTFIPLGKARGESIGNTYYITIHNPKKETAENSIRSVLQRISYTGAAA